MSHPTGRLLWSSNPLTLRTAWPSTRPNPFSLTAMAFSGSGPWFRIIPHQYPEYPVNNYRNNPADMRSLSENAINCIFEDRSGVLWIGTFGAGITYWIRRPIDLNCFATIHQIREACPAILSGRFLKHLTVKYGLEQ